MRRSIIGYTDMRKHSNKGFYTVEAAIFLPLVILAVLSLGYFIKVESIWENCIHGALDESRRIASRAYNHVEIIGTESKIRGRILSDNPKLSQADVTHVLLNYNDGITDHVTSYRMEMKLHLAMPADFDRDFSLQTGVKFRGFVGKRYDGSGMGSRLEQDENGQAVWIFPQAGEKYHGEHCTYVKASVQRRVLSRALRQRYESCGLCDSQELALGSIVFCFSGERTAYHRGTCRSIDRKTITVDRNEAEKRGYRPCSKCGGT